MLNVSTNFQVKCVQAVLNIDYIFMFMHKCMVHFLVRGGDKGMGHGSCSKAKKLICAHTMRVPLPIFMFVVYSQCTRDNCK